MYALDIRLLVSVQVIVNDAPKLLCGRFARLFVVLVSHRHSVVKALGIRFQLAEGNHNLLRAHHLGCLKDVRLIDQVLLQLVIPFIFLIVLVYRFLELLFWYVVSHFLDLVV